MAVVVIPMVFEVEFPAITFDKFTWPFETAAAAQFTVELSQRKSIILATSLSAEYTKLFPAAVATVAPVPGCDNVITMRSGIMGVCETTGSLVVLHRVSIGADRHTMIAIIIFLNAIDLFFII